MTLSRDSNILIRRETDSSPLSSETSSHRLGREDERGGGGAPYPWEGRLPGKHQLRGFCEDGFGPVKPGLMRAGWAWQTSIKTGDIGENSVEIAHGRIFLWFK